jgi:hypothetical protein
MGPHIHHIPHIALCKCKTDVLVTVSIQGRSSMVDKQKEGARIIVIGIDILNLLVGVYRR